MNGNITNHNNLKNDKRDNSHSKKSNKTKRIDWSKINYKDLIPFIIGIIILVALATGIGIGISKVVSMDNSSNSDTVGNTVTETITDINIVESTTETTTKEVESESTAEHTTEATTKMTKAIETTTHSTTKNTIESTTSTPTEAITVAPTEAPTEIITEAVTEVVTTAPTEPPTVSMPKYIAFLGDSITCGYYSDLIYTDVACNSLNSYKLIYGISGSTISDNSDGFVDRYNKISTKADCIVVYGGSNDYYNNVSLGTSDSNNKETFYGALNILCSGLKSSYPNAKIIFMTPLPGCFCGKYNSGNNDAGASIYDYVNATKSVCSKHGFYVLNTFSDTVITNNNYEDYTVDGLHPNENGHQILGDALTKYIKKLYS